jgi:hypothetical protein
MLYNIATIEPEIEEFQVFQSVRNTTNPDAFKAAAALAHSDRAARSRLGRRNWFTSPLSPRYREDAFLSQQASDKLFGIQRPRL